MLHTTIVRTTRIRPGIKSVHSDSSVIVKFKKPTHYTENRDVTKTVYNNEQINR